MKRIIGLTGPAGSGKTTSSTFFQNKGYQLINMDQVNHELLKEEHVVDKIKEAFPMAVEQGVVNRTVLGSQAFQKPEDLRKLESLLFPEFRTYLKNNLKDGLYLLDMAVLFQAECDSFCDMVIYVDADEDIRRNRLMNRIKKEDQVEWILNTQADFSKWKTKADVVLENNTSMQIFVSKLEELFKSIKQ